MMLHRHFEGMRNDNMTKLADVSPKQEGEDFVSEVFPPADEEKPKRGRKKKTEE